MASQQKEQRLDAAQYLLSPTTVMDFPQDDEIETLELLPRTDGYHMSSDTVTDGGSLNSLRRDWLICETPRMGGHHLWTPDAPRNVFTEHLKISQGDMWKEEKEENPYCQYGSRRLQQDGVQKPSICPQPNLPHVPARGEQQGSRRTAESTSYGTGPVEEPGQEESWLRQQDCWLSQQKEDMHLAQRSSFFMDPFILQGECSGSEEPEDWENYPLTKREGCTVRCSHVDDSSRACCSAWMEAARERVLAAARDVLLAQQRLSLLPALESRDRAALAAAPAAACKGRAAATAAARKSRDPASRARAKSASSAAKGERVSPPAQPLRRAASEPASSIMMSAKLAGLRGGSQGKGRGGGDLLKAPGGASRGLVRRAGLASEVLAQLRKLPGRIASLAALFPPPGSYWRPAPKRATHAAAVTRSRSCN